MTTPILRQILCASHYSGAFVYSAYLILTTLRGRYFYYVCFIRNLERISQIALERVPELGFTPMRAFTAAPGPGFSPD